MKKIDVINIKGEKQKELKLNEEIYNTYNEFALLKAIRKVECSLRQGTSKTKTRTEVSGGGRKPYRQKGTGNARQGSRRAPHFVKGGIVFGPTPRSYKIKSNKKERTLALKSALTDKLNSKELIVIDSLTIDNVKTKNIKELMDKLKLEGKVLFVSSGDAANLYLATRNLSNVDTLMYDDVNVLDIVNADKLVIEEEALTKIEEGISNAL